MSARAALRSFQGQKRTPGTSGSKGARYFSFQVMESAPMVRPWKEPSKATTSVRPCAFPMRRANFSAASTASAPELHRNTLPGNDSATSRSARSLAGCVWYRLLAWTILPAWRRIARTTSALP